MSVFRVKRHNSNFVMLHKGALENPRLSFKAKGLWAYCMSRPDNWEFKVAHLKKVSKEGEDAIYSALKELENEGYLIKIQQNQGGKFGPVDYEMHEIQIILPLRDFPDAGNPHAGNPALIRKDIKQGMICSCPPPQKSNKPKEKELPYTEQQQRYFQEVLEELKAKGKAPKHISLAYKAKVIAEMPEPVEKKRDLSSEEVQSNLEEALNLCTVAFPDGHVEMRQDILYCFFKEGGLTTILVSDPNFKSKVKECLQKLS